MKFIRIFLLALIIIGIGLLVTQKIWVPKLVVAILAHEGSQTTGTTSGWKTFHSDLYGFGVRYPSLLNDQINEPDALVLYLPPPPPGQDAAHASLEFEINRNSAGVTLESYYKKLFTETPKEDIVPVTIDGKSAVDFKSHHIPDASSSAGYDSDGEIVVPVDKWFLHITINNRAAYDQIKPGLVDLIMATLQFSEPKASSLLSMPTCSVKDLTAEVYAEGATGLMLGQITLTNTGTTTCTLEGYPQVQLFDSSQRPLPLEYGKAAGSPQKIWVEPAGKADATILWWNGCSVKNDPVYAIVTLPSGGKLTTSKIETGIPRCDDPKHPSTLSVDSFDR